MITRHHNKNVSFVAFYTFLLISLSVPVVGMAADETLSMDKLLQLVKEGRAKDAAENKKREEAFIAEKAQQEARIRQAMADVQANTGPACSLEKINGIMRNVEPLPIPVVANSTMNVSRNGMKYCSGLSLWPASDTM